MKAIHMFPLVVSTLLPAIVYGGDAMGRAHAEAVVSLVFDRLDCDLNGVIDPTEVDEHISQLWLPIDTDQSRALDRKEYSMTHRAVADTIADALFSDADRDADGRVDVDEFRAHIRRMILVLDDDRDGEISRADAGLKPWPTFKARRLTFHKQGADGS